VASLSTTLAEVALTAPTTGDNPAPDDARTHAARELAAFAAEHGADERVAAALDELAAGLARSSLLEPSTARDPQLARSPSVPEDRPSSVTAALATLQALAAERVALAEQRLAAERREAFAAVPLGALASIFLIGLALTLLNAEAGRRRRDEARFRAIFESAHQGIALLETDGRVRDINRTWFGATSTSAADLVGRPFWEAPWWPAEAREPLRTAVVAAAAGDLARSEAAARDEGGRGGILDLSVKAVHGPDGQVAYLLAEGRDISALKAAERALAENEERWSLALTGSDLGVWDWDARTDHVYFSPRWATMLGYQPSEIAPQLSSWSDRVHPDDLPPTMALIREHFAGQTPFYVSEHRMRAKDGSWRWILDRGQVITRSADGQPLRVIGTHTDITARRAAEQQLQESEERFRLAFDLAGIGMALVSLDGHFLRVNQALCELLGRSEAALLETDFQSLTHPDDLAIDLAQAARLTRGDIRSYTLDKRYLRSDGSVVWATLTGSLLRHADGSPRYFIAQMADITARKHAEQRETVAQDRLRGILRFSPTLITLFDLEDRYLLVNEAAARAIGRAPEDVVGKNVRELFPPEIASVFGERLARVREAGEPFSVEDTIATPGGPRTYLTNLFPLLDPQGRSYAIGGIASDVSTEREALRTTQRALAEREVLLRELHHRVKNNLQVISSLLSLQARTLVDPEQRRPFEEARKRVLSMGLIHDQLHRHRNLARIDFAVYLRDLVQLQRTAYGIASDRVASHIRVEVPSVPVAVAVPAGLIANEWLSNAFKHAFPGDRRGTIELALVAVADAWLLSVRDDGVAAASLDRPGPSAGLGLQLVQALCSQLGGRLETLPGPGWGQSVRFPVPSALENEDPT
jgi:PAS domain S-box-containing protein